jgi:hypothetical protein
MLIKGLFNLEGYHFGYLEDKERKRVEFYSKELHNNHIRSLVFKENLLLNDRMSFNLNNGILLFEGERIDYERL